MMSRSQSRRALLDEIAWGKNHDLLEDPVSGSLVRAWMVGAGDTQIEEMIRDRIRPFRVKDALGELHPFRAARLRDGELILGRDLNNNREVRYRAQQLPQGVFIVSATGYGKSNFINFLAPQVAATGCRVHIAEMYKKQMRHLRRVFRKMGDDLIVLRVQDRKQNILQSDAGDPREHLVNAVDLIARISDLPSLASTILFQVCHDLYREFYVLEGRKDAWPNLFDVVERIRVLGNRINAASRETLITRLSGLLDVIGPKGGAYRRSWRAQDLGRFNMVHEMLGTTEAAKELFLAPMLYSFMRHRIDAGEVNARLSLMTFWEDGQRFFSSRQAASGNMTGMDEMAGICRGEGLALAPIFQSTIGISRNLIPNLGTRFVGVVQSGEDFARLGSEMGWTSAQLTWARWRQSRGDFIGQSPDHPEPFTFHVPRFDVPTSVTDEEAAQSVQALDHLPTVPATEYANWTPHYGVRVASCTEPAADDLAGAAEMKLSDAELRYIQAVIHNPGVPSSMLPKLARISPKRAQKTRSRLVELGYFREHKVSTGKRGRTAIVLEPLEPALQAVQDATSEPT